MCMYVININQTQIITTKKIGILDLYHTKTLQENFSEDQTNNLCAGAHKRIRIHHDLWTKFHISTI